MRLGLIGKIRAKSGFVAHDAPPALLGALEPWLHAGAGASRLALGARWRSAFLAAPVWRFWLGGAICGAPTLGAFAPSIDADGRYFPLLLFALAEGARAIPPPEFSAQEEFLSAAEELLVGTLAPGARYEDALAALSLLPPPTLAPVEAAGAPVVFVRGGLAAPLDDHGPQELFARLRRADWARACAPMSFWSTKGGAGFRPLALAVSGLPDASLFAGFLTGDFSGGGAASMG